MNELFDVAGNFRAYRAAERAADPPYVPLLLIISKDITAIEENNVRLFRYLNVTDLSLSLFLRRA